MRNFFFTLFLVFAGVVCAVQEEPPRILVETLDQKGLASLVVQTDVSNAVIYINNLYVGTAPLTLSNLKPNTYLVTIKKQGYRERSISLTLSANTKTTVYMNLIPATGYLSIISDQSIVLIANGKTYNGNFIELPEGKYTCQARAFGFEDEYFDTEIIYNRTTYKIVKFIPAEFRAEDFSASNTAFNPRNAGLYGHSTISFSVTTYGYAHVDILDKNGNSILTYDTPIFTTWEQNIKWNGKDKNNSIVPDGTYTIIITFFDTSKAHEEQTLYIFKQEVNINSSLVFYPEFHSGYVPGSVFAPAIIPPRNTSLKTSTGFSYTSVGNYEDFGMLDFIVKASLSHPSIGRFELGASAATDPELLKAKLGLLLPLVVLKPVYFGFSCSSTIQSETAGGTSINAGLPITIGSREFSVTVTPGATITFLSSPLLNGYTELSLQYSTYNLSASLSGRLITSNLLLQDFTIALPAQIAFDFAFIPEESFIELGFWTGLIIKDSFIDVTAGFIITIDLINGY